MRRLLVPFTLILMGFIMTPSSQATETPRYETQMVDGAFELRSYPPTLVAETTYYPEKGERQNAAFQRLAAFIFGDNSSPNRDNGTSEKIAMTSPVTLIPTEESWTMRFMMPSQYTESTLPHPNDPGVRIFTDAGGMYASVRYSGRWTESSYQKKLGELKSWIQERNLQITGEPIIARYDPPWTLWFMRRNEVLLAVG